MMLVFQQMAEVMHVYPQKVEVMLVYRQKVEVMLVYRQMVEVMLVDVKQQDEGMHVDRNQHNHQCHHQHYYLLPY
jgi:hypothetical protein